MGNRQFVHLVDDDPAVRHSLGLMLITRGYGVQTHASAHVFLDSIAGNEAGSVLVTDVRMPDMSGVELLAALGERRLNMPVIVITAYADVPLAIQAMRLGAIDLIEKPIDDEVFVARIRHAMATSSAGKRPVAEVQDVQAKIDALTARESEVLKGLLDGKSNKMMAHDLGISIRTIEVHRSNVMSKLGARSISELVRMSLIAIGV